MHAYAAYILASIISSLWQKKTNKQTKTPKKHCERVQFQSRPCWGNTILS